MQTDDQTIQTVQPVEREPDTELERASKLLRAAAEIMTKHRISELEVHVGDVHITLRTSSGDQVATRTPAVGSPDTDEMTAAEREASEGHVVTAPMIGTFYAAPAPGEDPYVKVGDYVEEGSTIGIIEAMKIMNEIAADRSGELAEVLAENGQAVEFGSPLIRLRTS